jgi:MSHA biogenesis protein MshL
MKIQRLHPRLWLSALLVVTGGCASGVAVQQPVTRVRAFVDTTRTVAGTLEPAAPLVLSGAPRLPTSSGQALSNVSAPRIKELNAQGNEIRDVVKGIADQFGYDVSIDPEVRGRVTETLRNATMDQALKRIVTDNGYTYQLQGRVLRVEPIRLATKIFNLDYVSLSRYSSANTTVQRRLSVSGGGGFSGSATGLSSANGGAGGGGDVISAVSVADLWQEIRITLDGVMRPTTTAPRDSGVAVASSAPPISSNGGSASNSGAFSQSYADGSKLTISPMAGMITVTAGAAKLGEVQTVLEAFQSSVQRQVLIEAKIVEVQLSKATEFGINWSILGKAGTQFGFQLNSDPSTVVASSGSTGNVAFSLTGGNVQIDAVLRALNTQGSVNVLSSPRVSTLNNQRASFDVTTDEPFFSETRQPVIGPTGAIVSYNTQVTPQTISVGIVLDVLPQISADNIVSMNVRPVITSLLRTETFTGSDGATARVPVTDRREGDTMLRVRNGETVILGGLMQTDRTVDRTGIPGLMNLPLIGKLFTHYSSKERRTELVVFLTPTVIAGQPGAGR